MRARFPNGFSILELLFAVSILAVGLLACLSMMITGMSTNGRNKNNSQDTMVAQMVMEQINSVSANSQPSLTMKDCGGASWAVKLQTAAAPGNGAQIDPNTGTIDFTQPKDLVPAGYQMDYVACGSQPGEETTYDVRWNIRSMSPKMNLVTVSARQAAASVQGKSTPILFSPPVTLRTIQGM